MCGITGIYNLKGEKIDEDLLRRMTSVLIHRGPDDSGVFSDGFVGLGHTRLSIIDVSQNGHQPMPNEDKTVWAVYNGEVYNFNEIREELLKLGHSFKSKTDTEVILRSYEQWGEKCLDKFNGMFAFAIFDKNKDQLFLARDRLGKKPLYYYFDSEEFIFASEIKSILQNRKVAKKIDLQGIVNYFTFGHSIAPDTIYENIKKLLPGHYLILKNKKIEIRQYWDSWRPEEKDRCRDYYKKTISEIFEDSVKKRLISDVPLGIFLSGGIDSSSVAAVAARHVDAPIKTFSVGFDVPSKEFNETDDAKFVANYLKTDHHQIILKDSDLVENLDKIAYHFDEPFGDAANFPIFLMSKFAKNYVKVVLTGEGGDEIFGGYRRYMVEKNLSKLFLLRAVLQNNIAKKFISSTSRLRRLKQLLQTLPIKEDLLRQTNWLVCFSDEMRDQLFSSDLFSCRPDPFEIYENYANCHKPVDLLKNMPVKCPKCNGFINVDASVKLGKNNEIRASIVKSDGHYSEPNIIIKDGDSYHIPLQCYNCMAKFFKDV